MMNVQNVSFTGRDYAHAVKDAVKSKTLRNMEKQIAANKSKIDSYVAKLQNPEISNIEKKTILAKVNKLIAENERMRDVLVSRS